MRPIPVRPAFAGLTILLALAVAPRPADASFAVTFGDSWEGVPLQQLLDDIYGAGAIDVSQYEGAHPADADPPYWEDEFTGGLIVKELAGHRMYNEMGWYHETFSAPTIDGVDDGVIFVGFEYEGNTKTVSFPAGVTRFGLYLDPNGQYGTPNAPEGENFFTNRAYNDIGPDGSGALHSPTDGDVQVLIYDISHLRQGVPTYVVCWEDLDSGGPISPTNQPGFTDNDYNDMVVEISADSPVATESGSWGSVKALFQR